LAPLGTHLTPLMCECFKCAAKIGLAVYTVYLLLQICNFGLAKWKEQAATQRVAGIRRGTVAYMAPEVFRDPTLPRTIKYDVYSFGIVLWELLSGQKPFEAGKCSWIHLPKLDVLPVPVDRTL